MEDLDFEYAIDAIDDIGGYDFRKEFAGNCKGHMGKVEVADDVFVLERGYCDPFWCANHEILIVRKVEGGVEVTLHPEDNNKPAIRRKFIGREFADIAISVANLGKGIQNGPTFVYNQLMS